MALEPKKISELTDEQRIAQKSALLSYRSVHIRLNQSGTSVPTATVLIDDVGIGDISVTRNQAGIYSISLGEVASLFPQPNTEVTILNQFIAYPFGPTYSGILFKANLNTGGPVLYVYLSSYGVAPTGSLTAIDFGGNTYGNTIIEIRVYN